MTDKEMLELAAKAYGVEVYESTDGTVQNRPVLVFSAGGTMGTMPYEERWDPLAHYAQAFMLVVKLKLNIEWRDASVLVGAEGQPCSYKREYMEDRNSDTFSTICRAITMAAAEIGKDMK